MRERRDNEGDDELTEQYLKFMPSWLDIYNFEMPSLVSYASVELDVLSRGRNDSHLCLNKVTELLSEELERERKTGEMLNLFPVYQAIAKFSDREIRYVDDAFFKIALFVQELKDADRLPKERLEVLMKACAKLSGELMPYSSYGIYKRVG